MTTKKSGTGKEIQMGNKAPQSNSAKQTKPSETLLLEGIILKNLQKASIVFQRELSEPLIEAWLETITEKRPIALAWAFNKYFEREKFFPTPGHIYEYIRQWYEDHLADVQAEQEEQRKLEYQAKRAKELAEKGITQ